MSGERGMSFVEVVVAMGMVAIIATTSVTFVLPWLDREEMRGAVYQVQQAMQLGRSQAIARKPVEIIPAIPPNSGLRCGVFQVESPEGLILSAIVIRKDQRSGQWTAGDGRKPITSFVPPALKLG